MINKPALLITTKKGYILEAIYSDKDHVTVLGVRAKVTVHQGVKCMLITSAPVALSTLIGAKVTGKQVALSLIDEEYERVMASLGQITAEREWQQQEELNAKIAASEQRTVLIFSGWYLSDAPRLATMYRDADRNVWFIKETHQTFSKAIYPSMAMDMGLTDTADMPVNYEARIMLVTPDQAEALKQIDAAVLAQNEVEAAAEQDKQQAATNAIFTKAKRTGEAQVLTRQAHDYERMEAGELYTSVVVATTYALPDGTTKEITHDTY